MLEGLFILCAMPGAPKQKTPPVGEVFFCFG